MRIHSSLLGCALFCLHAPSKCRADVTALCQVNLSCQGPRSGAHAEGGKTGSVWISWSTGTPSFTNSTAQFLAASNRYADDYQQPPLFGFTPQPEPQTPDPASVASQARDLPSRVFIK